MGSSNLEQAANHGHLEYSIYTLDVHVLTYQRKGISAGMSSGLPLKLRRYGAIQICLFLANVIARLSVVSLSSV